MKRPDRCPCPCPGQALLLPPAPPGSAGHPLILFPLSACSVSNYSFGLKSSWSVTPCLMPCLNPWVHSGASPCFKELQTISTAKQQTLALKSAPCLYSPCSGLGSFQLCRPCLCGPQLSARGLPSVLVWRGGGSWPTNVHPLHSKPCDPTNPSPVSSSERVPRRSRWKDFPPWECQPYCWRLA